jgi:peptidoglycan hydrolase-like protein with peptidoglycan-binding domain
MLRRAARVLVVLGIVCSVGAVGFFAGRRAISTTPGAPAVAAPNVIMAETDTLVDQRPVQVLARWVEADEVLLRRPGTITATALSPETRVSIGAGAELFKIDQVPVIAMPGIIPAFRDLASGARGDDVAQVQSFLVAEGANDLAVDGKWSTATTRAWEAWQRAQGYAPQPGAPLGTIVFFGEFPVTIAAPVGHRVGGIVAVGDALAVLDPTPRFNLVAPAGSQPSLPQGATVTLTVGGVALEFTVSDSQTRESDGTTETLLQSTSPMVCAQWCDGVGTNAPTPFSATATVAGPVTGVVVPLGVIRTKAQDQLFVVDGSGTERPVTIVLRVGSSAVVEGLEAGASIEVPATVGE